MALIIRNSLGLDHPSVQSVIKIAREIIRDNKVLDTEILYNIAKRRLKIPRRGLLRIIQYLLNKKILVEGTKCTKGTVLSNYQRRKIYNFIQSHLGVHFSIIRKVLFSDTEGKSQATGQLLWHLEMLTKFNYIKKVNFKKYVIFIPVEIDDEAGIVFFLLRDKVNKRIANLLIQQGNIKKSDVYKMLEENREMVYYRINELINFNIISPLQEESSKIQLNPNNRELIAQIINEESKLRK
ncbi:MAG: hypothetical protein ACFFDK_18075 [Promethearchaeota archaeon]